MWLLTQMESSWTMAQAHRMLPQATGPYLTLQRHQKAEDFRVILLLVPMLLRAVHQLLWWDHSLLSLTSTLGQEVLLPRVKVPNHFWVLTLPTSYQETLLRPVKAQPHC